MESNMSWHIDIRKEKPPVGHADILTKLFIISSFVQA